MENNNEKNDYDVLVVGAGLFGATVAREALDDGFSVLVVDRRSEIGGNCATSAIEGIMVHQYGAHIFRTDSKETWDYLSRFCTFNNFVNSPIAYWHDEAYNLPFNMNTFHQLWGIRTPVEAKARIEQDRVPCDKPENLEEHVLSLAGREIYEKLVKEYTEKQWGTTCDKLPPSIMRRIPLRFTYDNNYFNVRYQGIPEEGYSEMIRRMLEGATVLTGVDFLEYKNELAGKASLTVYTGPIDEYFSFALGPLGYRGLRFEHELLEEENHQGVAVVNYTSWDVPYTRTIEHKHFVFKKDGPTVVTREYPTCWKPGDEPYYPMEDEANRSLYDKYQQLSSREEGVVFGGRLGEYRYYDMQDTVRSARTEWREWQKSVRAKRPRHD